MINFFKKLVTKKENVYELDLDQDFENEYFDNSDLGEPRNPTDTELKMLRSKVNAILYPEAEELLTSTDNPNELDVFEEIIQLESLTSEPEKPSDVFQGSQAHQKAPKEAVSDDFTMYEEDVYVDNVDDAKSDENEDEFDSAKLFETETNLDDSEPEENEIQTENPDEPVQNEVETQTEAESESSDFFAENSLEKESNDDVVQDSNESANEQNEDSETQTAEVIENESNEAPTDETSESDLGNSEQSEDGFEQLAVEEDNTDLQELETEAQTENIDENNVGMNADELLSPIDSETNSDDEPEQTVEESPVENELAEESSDETEMQTITDEKSVSSEEEVPEAVESTTTGIEEDDTEDDLDLFDSDDSESITEIEEDDEVTESEKSEVEEIAFDDFAKPDDDILATKDDLDDVEGEISFEDDEPSDNAEADIVVETEESQLSEKTDNDLDEETIDSEAVINDSEQTLTEENVEIGSDVEAEQAIVAENNDNPVIEAVVKEDHSLVAETESQISNLHDSYSVKMNQFKEKANEAIDFIDQQSKANFADSDQATILKSLNWLKESATNFQLFYLSNFLNQLIRSFEIKQKHTDFDIGKIAIYPSRENLTADEEHLITAVNEIAQINSAYEKSGRKPEQRFTNTELSENKDRLIPGKVKKINRSDRKRVVLAKN